MVPLSGGVAYLCVGGGLCVVEFQVKVVRVSIYYVNFIVMLNPHLSHEAGFTNAYFVSLLY